MKEIVTEKTKKGKNSWNKLVSALHRSEESGWKFCEESSRLEEENKLLRSQVFMLQKEINELKKMLSQD